jgi:hypothetical protein
MNGASSEVCRTRPWLAGSSRQKPEQEERQPVPIECDVVGEDELSVDLDPFELLPALAPSADLHGELCTVVLDEVVGGLGAARALEVFELSNR